MNHVLTTLFLYWLRCTTFVAAHSYCTCQYDLLDHDNDVVSLVLAENYTLHMHCKCPPGNKGQYSDQVSVLFFGETTKSISMRSNDLIDQKHNVQVISEIFAESAILLNGSTKELEKAESYTITYRMCSSNTFACQSTFSACEFNNSFCLQHLEATGGQACEVLTPEMCKVTHGRANSSRHVACNANDHTKGLPNVCTAFAQKQVVHYTVTERGGNKATCEETTHLIVKDQNGSLVPANGYVQLANEADSVTVECKGLPQDTVVRCRLHNYIGELTNTTTVTCREGRLGLGALRGLTHHGHLRVHCAANQTAAKTLRLLFNVVYLDKKLNLVGPDATCSKTEYVCHFNNSAHLGPRGFQFKYESRRMDSADSPILSDRVTLNSSYPTRGLHFCSGTATYPICDSQIRRITLRGNGSVLVPDCSHVYDKFRALLPSEKRFWIIVGVGVGTLFILLIAVCMILVKRGIIGAVRWRNQEMREVCEEVADATLKSVAKLVSTADALLADKAAAQKLLEEKTIRKGLEDFQREEFKDALVEIPTCRNSDVKCLRTTMVKTARPLNINKMKDFLNLQLYVGQSPVTGEFVPFWQLIDQSKVNVVVWFVNSFGDVHLPFPTRPQLVEKYSTFSVRQVSVYALAAVFRVYEVVYSNSTDKDVPKRVNFVEVAGWPEKAMPPDLENLAKLLDETEFYELKLRRDSRGKHSGVMSLCGRGCGQSCSFAAALLARQQFIVQRQTNPAGMMRYLRVARHGAFTMAESPALAVQSCFAVLKTNLRAMVDQEKKGQRPRAKLDMESLYGQKMGPGTADTSKSATGKKV